MDGALLWLFCHVPLTGAISSKYLLLFVRCPTHFYGMKAVHLSQIALKNIESTQGSLTVQALVLSKYSLARKALAGSRKALAHDTIYTRSFLKFTNYYFGKNSQLFKLFALYLLKKFLEVNS